MIKAGIVGMGVIGQHIAKAIDNGIPGVTLAGVSVRTATTAGGFAAYPLDELIRTVGPRRRGGDAGGAARLRPRRAHARASTSWCCRSAALVGVLDEWARLAERHGCRILVPSGAIAGLDGMKGAREGAITAVTMETRKPPRGLAGAPWIVEQRIDLDAITGETLIFEGSAARAVKAFPANVNVVAALSLAGIGPERTRIKIFAVPGQVRNQHRITIEGEFGRLRVEIENVPSDNPRTGKLSYLSAIAMLRELGTPVRVGS